MYLIQILIMPWVIIRERDRENYFILHVSHSILFRWGLRSNPQEIGSPSPMRQGELGVGKALDEHKILDGKTSTIKRVKP